MESDATKWLMGCGLGCAVLILILAVMGLGGFFLVKDTVEDFEQMGRAVEKVKKAYGKPGDFVPASDGRLAKERIEAFLRVRESTEPVRKEIEESLETVISSIDTMEDEGESFFGIVRIIGIGAGAIPKVAAFHTIRAQALLDEEMGLGEYCYLYALVYYSWLGKPPSDGPPFTLVGRDGDDNDSESEEEARASRERRIQREVRELFVSILENGAEDCQRPENEALDEWCEALREEIEALRDDREHLPWQGGLPRTLEASLVNYRDALNASYSELVNPLELGE